MNKMFAPTHLIIGIILFAVFAVTGRYMRTDFPDKEAIDQSLRLLMRSGRFVVYY